MIKDQIDAVLERVRSWPQSRQEDAVLLLLEIEAQGSSPYALSAEERRDIKAALEEADRGEFASESEVEALFARYRE